MSVLHSWGLRGNPLDAIFSQLINMLIGFGVFKYFNRGIVALAAAANSLVACATMQRSSCCTKLIKLTLTNK